MTKEEKMTNMSNNLMSMVEAGIPHTEIVTHQLLHLHAAMQSANNAVIISEIITFKLLLEKLCDLFQEYESLLVDVRELEVILL